MLLLTFTFSVMISELPRGFAAYLFAMELKEQYPVTAHAPNFDFWTGCREIKRCEESKRS